MTTPLQTPVTLTPTETSFLTWLSTNNAISTKITWPVLHPNSTYRLAIANATILPNEPIVEIPFNLMICAPNCLRDPADQLGVLLRDMWLCKALNGDALLCLCICREVNLKEKSFFYPYLRFLLDGEEPGTLANWSLEQSNELQDSMIVERNGTRNEDEEKEYERCAREVTNQAIEFSDTLGIDVTTVLEELESVTLPLYIWSWHVIQARAFGRRLPWSALVPLADCLNHSNLPVRYNLTSIQGSGKVGSQRIGTTDPGPNNGTYTIYPSGDNTYLKGKEVFNSYGRRSNEHLLLDYGFCIVGNEWEVVTVKIMIERTTNVDDLVANRIFAMKRRLLSNHGMTTTKKLKVRLDTFPFEGVIFFRIASMNYDELLNALGESANDNDAYVNEEVKTITKVKRISVLNGGENVVNIGNEKRSLSSLIAVLLSSVSENNDLTLNQSISYDEDKLKQLNADGPLNNKDTGKGKKVLEDYERMISAIGYRLTRKRIVKSNVELMRYACNSIVEKKEENENDESCGLDWETKTLNLEACDAPINNFGWIDYKRSWTTFFSDSL